MKKLHKDTGKVMMYPLHCFYILQQKEEKPN